MFGEGRLSIMQQVYSSATRLISEENLSTIRATTTTSIWILDFKVPTVYITAQLYDGQIMQMEGR